jgi:hypothetical protein
MDLTGEVRLARRTYRVFSDGDLYLVRSLKPGATTFEEEIASSVVLWLEERLKGRRVDKDEAAGVLKTRSATLSIPYQGYKLAFYAQAVLVILVALGKAAVEVEGRRYFYRL